jgi:HEAT repeat protein
MDAMGNIGPAARDAVPALLRNATNGDSSLRWHASNALAAIGAEPGRVVPVLTNALQDENSRPSAAFALGEFGPSAKPAASLLIALLKSPQDRTDKSIYTNALKKIDPEAAAQAGVK